MGYGGTGYATVTVDIAQTDIDAIVQGITGYSGITLTDVDGDLGYLMDYLYDYSTYQSAASLLADIRSLLQQLSFDAGGRLRVNTTG